MRFMTVFADYETAGRVGAIGTFQAIELNEGDKDVTHLVDQGTHYHSVDELRCHLERLTGDEIDLTEA